MRTLALGAGATSLLPEALCSQATRPLGVALPGLGKYSTGQLDPALQQTKHCRLAGVATGSPAEARQWQ